MGRLRQLTNFTECDIINIESQGKDSKISQLSEDRDNSGAINTIKITELCWLDDRRLLRTKQLEWM